MGGEVAGQLQFHCYRVCQHLRTRQDEGSISVCLRDRNSTLAAPETHVGVRWRTFAGMISLLVEMGNEGLKFFDLFVGEIDESETKTHWRTLVRDFAR